MDYESEARKAGIHWGEARDRKSLIQAQHLRYRVYCVSRGYEAGSDTLEKDVHDPLSHHVLVYLHNVPVATTRLVPLKFGPPPIFDVLSHAGFEPEILTRGMPEQSSCEISRFAILGPEAEDITGLRNSETRMLIRLTLLRAMVAASFRHGVTHWVALMEPSLQRMLNALSICFDPMTVHVNGEQIPVHVDHRGRRNALRAERDRVLTDIRSERMDLWTYLTMDNKKHTEPNYGLRETVYA